MPKNPFAFEFNPQYKNLSSFAATILENMDLLYYKGRGFSDEDIACFDALHEQVHCIAKHNVSNLLAIQAADHAVVVLKEHPHLKAFIAFAQTQECFALEIKSEGLLYLLHFLQAHINPIVNQTILYTAGVPEWAVRNATNGMSSEELKISIANEYTVFNARLSFVIALREINPIIEKIPSIATLKTENIPQVEYFFQELNRVLGKMAQSEAEAEAEAERISFSHKEVDLMINFFTTCETLFTAIRNEKASTICLTCIPAKLRLNKIKESLSIEPSSLASSSSSFFPSDYSSAMIDIENTELIRTRHNMTVELEKQINRLDNKMHKGLHLQSTRKKAEEKSRELCTLKTSIKTAQSVDQCQRLIIETLNHPAFKEDPNSTSSKALTHLYETFASGASCSASLSSSQ